MTDGRVAVYVTFKDGLTKILSVSTSMGEWLEICASRPDKVERVSVRFTHTDAAGTFHYHEVEASPVERPWIGSP